MPAKFVAPFEAVETCLQQRQQGQDKAMIKVTMRQCLVCDQKIFEIVRLACRAPCMLR